MTTPFAPMEIVGTGKALVVLSVKRFNLEMKEVCGLPGGLGSSIDVERAEGGGDGTFNVEEGGGDIGAGAGVGVII